MYDPGMTTLTSIGEQLVTVGSKSVKFRPSLLAMTRIGSPREIVETFVSICGSPALTGNAEIDADRVKRWRRRQFDSACCVMWACAESEDISWLVGYVNERFRYIRGALPMDDIVGLAFGLLKHGVMGDVKAEETRRAKKSEYVKEFDARGYAASAMAHLGLNEAEAWNMTMTSYIGAMKAKYPPPADKKDNDPRTDAERFDSAKDFLARVKAAKLAKEANRK